jgi:competence protein ComFC
MKEIWYYSLQRHFIDPLIDVLFPPLCYICYSLLPPHRKIICQVCWEKIPPFKGNLDNSLKDRSFNNLFILFEFEETIRLLIHLLKYKRHLTLAQYFARATAQCFPLFRARLYTAIVPVPLYKTRKRERGYNQSEELSKALGQLYHIPVDTELLLRMRYTASQTRMSREEREKNVKNAFYCPHKTQIQRILLVDDVITTGSTIEACIQALKNAGTNEVDVLAIAHPRRDSNNNNHI